VNTTRGADRVVAQAFDLAEARGEPFMLADEMALRDEYEAAAPELQRAVMIATDAAQVAEEFGATSPQALLIRELYAAAAVDAASHGVIVPYLDPLVRVASGQRSGDCVSLADVFSDEFSGCMLVSSDSHFDSEIAALSKTKTAPDIYSQRQMAGPEWDTPKQSEIHKIERLEAKKNVWADDPSIKGMPVGEMCWAGRCKRNPDGTVLKYNARCCARGDIDKLKCNLTSNDAHAPVARNTSMMAFDAVGCLRTQHMCDYDVPGAYLQGEQLSHEARVYRPPPGFRVVDERGVEQLWYSLHPFYGQTDAGAIWNRTVNTEMTSDPPDGCGLQRCPADPSVYGINVSDGEVGGQVNSTLYVDDGRIAWDPAAPATRKADQIKARLAKRFGIEFGKDDPAETHFRRQHHSCRLSKGDVDPCRVVH
jgi:hypothetical protein